MQRKHIKVAIFFLGALLLTVSGVWIGSPPRTFAQKVGTTSKQPRLTMTDSLTGAVFTVTKTADTDDGTCDSDCSLREAIAAANAATTDDIIDFDPAVFSVPQTITLTGSHLQINGQSNNGTLTIDGPHANLLTISGDNLLRVFYLNTSSTAAFSDLTIADGGVGAIQIHSGADLTLNAVIIRDNTGANGAVFVDNSGSTLDISNSRISGNTGTSGSGGISNSSGTVTITNSTISGNTGAIGAGIWSAGGTVRIEKTLISGNTSSINGGGGIHTSANMEIVNSTIDNNHATSTAGGGVGGGIHNMSSLTIERSTISNNTAGDSGGGISHNTLDPLTLINTTVSGNSAEERAGGIDILSTSVDILSSTIVGNSTCPGSPPNCAGGGGLRTLAEPDIHNSIIANNTDGSSNANDILGSINSLGYNLIEDTTMTTINGNTAGNILLTDPNLGPLQDNGGGLQHDGKAARTHKVLPGSPVIDAGDPGTFPVTDQRGAARAFDSDGNGSAEPEIGAYEWASIFNPHVPGSDFDGDDKTDLAIFRPLTTPAQWWYLRSSGGGTYAYSFGLGTDKPVPQDFTGDGQTDLAFFREATSEWFVLRSENSTFYSFPFGFSGDIPAPGDFDGDGMADACVYRPATGTWFISRSSDGGVTIETFGVAEDRPVVGDYDGDGLDDIAIFRPSVSEWWINRSRHSLIAYQFGMSGDKTVQGDYTGDGRADVAFWRPSSGEWFILRSEDSSFYAFPFGANGDIPSPGDYDGDGMVDAAVFRPSAATWYINESVSGIQILGFGSSTDIPLPSVYSVP